MSPEFLALQRLVAGRYSLDRELGRGGMGVVFLARDVALERPVAIKLLPPALARVPGARERFLREARLAARLSHPHIVPIHAVESHDDLAFFVMAYVDGETLGERVRRLGPLPPRTLARVLREVAWALAHAHAHGIVHRDVKPENVLLERGGDDGARDAGRALVTDFGIAQPASDASSSGARGTPAFMSPEQGAGRTVDARSDLWSFGVTAWVVATGALPWASEGARLLAWEGKQPLPSIATVAPGLPRALAAAIDRCLQVDPAARWETADALVHALDVPAAATVAVPPAVRRFLREADVGGAELATALGGALSTMAVLGGRYGLTDLFSSVVIWAIVAVFAMLGMMRLGRLLGAMLGLQLDGWGHDAVRAAVAAEEATRREEDHEPAGSLRPTLATFSALAAATGAGLLVSAQDESLALSLLGAGMAVAAPTAALSRLYQLGGRGARWFRRVLAGRVGKALFRLARVGKATPALPAPYAGEPTALAIGRGIEQLWAAIPAGDRAALGDVPALVARLEAQALSLRAGADRDPARAEQLATTVATLEAVRLDLLRLRARELDAGGMTTTLGEAERVMRYVDGVLTPG